jgi:hypothetical protein
MKILSPGTSMWPWSNLTGGGEELRKFTYRETFSSNRKKNNQNAYDLTEVLKVDPV